VEYQSPSRPEVKSGNAGSSAYSDAPGLKEESAANVTERAGA
jgi:hypothetical protein